MGSLGWVKSAFSDSQLDHYFLKYLDTNKFIKNESVQTDLGLIKRHEYLNTLNTWCALHDT